MSSRNTTILKVLLVASLLVNVMLLSHTKGPKIGSFSEYNTLGLPRVTSEESCNSSLTKEAPGPSSMNGASRNTTKVHWNTKRGVCLLEVTKIATDFDGVRVTEGIVTYNLANFEIVSECFMSPKSGETSCNDDAYKAKQLLLFLE